LARDLRGFIRQESIVTEQLLTMTKQNSNRLNRLTESRYGWWLTVISAKPDGHEQPDTGSPVYCRKHSLQDSRLSRMSSLTQSTRWGLRSGDTHRLQDENAELWLGFLFKCRVTAL